MEGGGVWGEEEGGKGKGDREGRPDVMLICEDCLLCVVGGRRWVLGSFWVIANVSEDV